MKTVTRFDHVVGLVERLSLPQKESLAEILSKRLIEQRRMAMQKDIRDANREFSAGACRAVKPAELMQEIAG